MNYRYFIFNGAFWVQCGYSLYMKWKGKKKKKL